jgi:subtilisin family serine protease
MKTPQCFALLAALLVCAWHLKAQPSSNHCFAPDGRQITWYHQPDVFAFRLLGSTELPVTFPRSIVRAAYTRTDMPDRLSILEFAEGIPDSTVQAVQAAVRMWPDFECAFEVVRHVPGLPNTRRGWSAVDDQVLVTFRDPYIAPAQIADFAARHHLALTRPPAPGLVPGHCHAYTFVVEAPYHCETGGRAIDVCRRIWLQDSASVMIAEPNLVMAFEPFTNDTFYGTQWHIQNIAQPLPYNNPPGVLDNDHDIDRMWALGFKGAGIRVAVVDLDEFDLVHEDMQGAFVDGWDVVHNHILYTIDTNSINGSAHGMCVSGILGARAENYYGMAGVAPECKIMPIWIGTTAAMLVDGIQHAVAFSNDTAKMNHILNLSLGTYLPLATIHNEIKIAKRVGRNGHGMIIVGAAGNDNSDTISFPGAFPELIQVSGSNPIDQRKSLGDPWDYQSISWGSNFNSSVDVAAGSCLLWTTDHTGRQGYKQNPDASGNYYLFDGTSGAVPIVSAVCAMILEANPNLVDTGNGTSQVRDLIRAGAEKVHPNLYDYNAFPLEPGRSLEMGYGRLNGYSSLVLVGMKEAAAISLSPLMLHVLAEKSALRVFFDLPPGVGSLELVLTDCWGREIQRHPIQVHLAVQDIPLPGLSAGIYLGHLESKGQIVSSSTRFAYY